MAAGNARHAMDMDPAMIVAGIGSRKGVARQDVLRAIESALEKQGLATAALSALATAALKKDEEGIMAAGLALGLPVVIVGEDALRAAAARTMTRSGPSWQAAASPSVSEAAALAAAGEAAVLAGPRVVAGPVTCAIAISGDR
ncbi:MAG: cobalamin biosynthesis protein [Rhizobiaceae bacterium]|nr:cobalamin biosynthesis protein [Rhizobiaceae bacterium]